MTHRKQVVAVLNGQTPPVIPCLGECPMDVTVDALAPRPTGDPVADAIAIARSFDNSAVEIGLTPTSETLSRDETHRCYRYETGAVWKEIYQPSFNREPVSFPINSPEDVFRYEMPDAADPGRVDDQEIRRQVRALHEAGYFVQGSVIGAWQGIYYHLTSFDHILTWMAIEPAAARRLFDMTGKFSLDSARRLLECGVDCVFSPSDLGSGSSLLFSPAMFRRYVFPWLKDLAGLCHDHGAYLHLHSHGHIEEIMDGIVAAGVDIVNPVGPSDHNDLAVFKRNWGQKIVLHGGISTRISIMTEDEIARHVEDVVSAGRVGGRFFPRTESGIPPMPAAKARFYLETLRRQRLRGFA